MKGDEITDSEVEGRYQSLKAGAERQGLQLNPDEFCTKDLVRGLLVNESRYGYPACPCRLASGDCLKDLAPQCPCNDREADLREFGQCFCGLYLSPELADRPDLVCSIPQRSEQQESGTGVSDTGQGLSPEHPSLTPSYPVWRCPVCGYLAARTEPPPECPICKARKERFERFL